MSQHGIGFSELENICMENIIGILAGSFTAASLVPQLVKMVSEKKAADISPIMLIILLCGLALWVVYGLLKNDLPILITNSFSFVINLTILILQKIYPEKN